MKEKQKLKASIASKRTTKAYQSIHPYIPHNLFYNFFLFILQLNLNGILMMNMLD